MPWNGRHPLAQFDPDSRSGTMRSEAAGPMAIASRLLPPVTPDTEAWWFATRSRRLTAQRCHECNNLQLYPRAICTACGATDLGLEDVSGFATVYAATVVERSPDAQRFKIPYVVALVDLDEGPRLLTNILASNPYQIRCGDTVRATWEPLDDGRNLPVFTVAVEG